MIRRAIVLTGLYLVTTALLAGIFHANSLVLMGIHDVCASQCAGAAGVGLGILYVAALAQVGRRREPWWFARVCLGHLLISLVWLLWGVPFRPQPTPYLLLSAWLSIAAMEAAGAVVRRLRWR